MSSPVQAKGIPWYLDADYETLRALFIDGDKLPRSFLQWQDKANEVRKRYVRQGYIVVAAHIDPTSFPAWCAANGLQLDSHARAEFANREAYRIAMQANPHR